MMADPLTKLHCCIRSDGGGAVVLTTEERARDLAKKPVWVLGTGEATSHTTMSEWDDFTALARVRERPARVRAGGREARRHRHLPDLRRVHAHGAREPRRRSASASPAKAARSSRTASSASAARSRPTPTAAACRTAIPGMRGMFLLVEATRQLRGEAHGRQVENAQLACVNGTGGWFSSASTVILGA